MTKEKHGTEEQQTRSNPGDAWADLGRQFSKLGESMAAAFTSSWQNEETQQHAQNIQTGLEGLARQFGESAEAFVQSVDAEKVQAEMEQAARAAQQTGQEAVNQTRPQVVAAFRSLREELDRIIHQMEENAPRAAGPATGEADAADTAQTES